MYWVGVVAWEEAAAAAAAVAIQTQRGGLVARL